MKKNIVVLGLSNACVLQTMEDLKSKATEMLSLYGPVIIQRFIGGRGASR